MHFTLHSSPFTKKRAAFTLAEGATHVALFDDIRQAAFNLVKGNTHVAHFDKIRRAAFTLAEVLITLGIIGIVAAMTMPVLIGNYQKTQAVNQLKKAYSEISQAIRISEAQYGTIDSWNFSNFSTAQERADYFAQNYIFPNIKILQNCSPSSEKCWADTYTIDGAKSNNYTNGRAGRNSFITASGYAVYYWLHATGNGGWFIIDLNGLKKPNKLGKDVFIFIMSWGNRGSAVTEDKCTQYKLGLLPYGVHCVSLSPTRDELLDGTFDFGGTGSSFNCKKGTGTNTGGGGYCGAVIMMDGWQMEKDYPW